MCWTERETGLAATSEDVEEAERRGAQKYLQEALHTRRGITSY